MQWVELILTGVIAGLISASATYFFALRQDKEARRRERIVAHLIEAYRNLEHAAQRDPMSTEAKQRVESSLAAIFLLGSKESANAAKQFAESMSAGHGDLVELLKTLRRDLRQELGLEQHDVSPAFLRFQIEQAKRS
jgi:2-oxoglutarate dehydrogenase complex dehydrogenase (E1) component-like enzyme